MRLFNAACGFGADRSGATAIVFAMLLIPILLIAGGAIDYSNAKSQQADLQNTLDSATLAGGRALANGEDVEAAVGNYLHASWPKEIDLPGYQVEIADKKDVSVTFAQPAVVKTKILGMFGWGEMPAIVASVATITSPTMDISLVLDASDSMKKKLDMAKNESHGLLTRIESANNGVAPNSDNWVSVVVLGRSGITKYYQLSDNIPGLRVPINEARFDGNTALGPGLQQGWDYLKSPTRCQQWGQACGGPEPEQYVVLLSDGDEDARLGPSAPVCAGIRASGIKLIVIAFAPEHGQKNTDTLRTCAGDQKNFYWANGQQLAAVFDNIIREKSQPRLKQ